MLPGGAKSTASPTCFMATLGTEEYVQRTDIAVVLIPFLFFPALQAAECPLRDGQTVFTITSQRW